MCERYRTDRIIFFPEFIREKNAVRDVVYPSRILVGYNKTSDEILKKIKYML